MSFCFSGDVCDSDIDGDGVNNDIDNCVYFSNPTQTDSNGNYTWNLKYRIWYCIIYSYVLCIIDHHYIILLIRGPSWSYAISAYHHYRESVSCSWRGVLDTTLCDKVCLWLAAGLWFSLSTLVSSTNKTECNDIVESDVKHHKPNSFNKWL